MGVRTRPSAKSVIARGVVSGVAGTVVMTAFQRIVEMPLTKRGESYAPANFAETITPVDTETHEGRRRLNYITHFSFGAMWGATYGVAALKGCAGRRR